jgi:hypothetical protein
MASKYWIKLYHDLLDDAKMGRLRDRLWRRAIECFLMAGELDEGGWLPSLEDMAWKLMRGNEELLESELVELASVGILEQRDGRWFVTNFATRQAAVSASERGKRFRKRQVEQSNIDMRTETERNANETFADEIRIDTDESGCAPADGLRIAISGEGRAMTAEQVWGCICDLIDVYCELTRAPFPKLADARQVERNRERWVIPGDTLMRLCDDNYQDAEQLLRDVVAKMDADGIPHSSLGSLVTNARSIRFRKVSENGDGKAALLERVTAYARRRLEWGDCSPQEQRIMRAMTGNGGPEDLRSLKDDALRISFYQALKEVTA